MGRVSKHKRIKSHDPFYRGQRRDRRKGEFDLCPENVEDQPVPKSLIRLMKRTESIKKTNEGKKKMKNGGEELGVDATAVEGSDLRKRKKIKNKGGGVGGEEPVFTRRKGESLKSYLERIDVETNAKIMETFRKNRKPSDRRQKRLQERKRKARRKGLSTVEKDDIEQDKVKFGEVVQAPPQLRARPRGSKTATTASSSKQLLLQQTLTKISQPTPRKTFHSSQIPVGLKRKKDLEIERERAISAYRKSKRTTHFAYITKP